MTVWRGILLCLIMSSVAFCRARTTGYCTQGGQVVVTSTVPSVTKVQQSYPQCTITVYISGTLTLASLYSDNAGTPKSNPFTSSATGMWFYYVDNGDWDAKLSGGGIPAPFTIGAISSIDPLQVPYVANYIPASSGGASLSLQCSAANTAKLTLSIAVAVTAVSTTICPSTVQFLPGGSVQPSSGQKITFSISPGQQGKICDISLSGSCYITSSDGVLNTSWWGSAPGTDSTTAFQAAINTCMYSSALTSNSCQILIPTTQTNSFSCASAYILSNTLLYNSQNEGHSISIVGGGGAYGTCIQWEGAANLPMIRMNGWKFGTIKNLVLLAPGSSATAGYGIWVDAIYDSVITSPAQSTAQLDILDGVIVGAAAIADVQVGHPGGSSVNVSQVEVKNSYFTSSPIGVNIIGSGNIKVFSVHDNQFLENGTGIFISGGPQTTNLISHNVMLQSSVVDYNVQAGTTTIISTSSEGSLKLLDCGSAVVYSNCHLLGGYWAGTTDSSLNVISVVGSLDIEGFDLENSFTSTSIPRISLSNLVNTGAGTGSLVSKQNYFKNVTAKWANGPFFDDGAGSVNVATYGRTNGVLVNASSESDFGCTPSTSCDNEVSHLSLPPFTALSQIATQNLFILADTGSGVNVMAGTVTYTPVPTLNFGDSVTIIPAHTLGASNTNTFQYAGTIHNQFGSDVTNTAIAITSCRTIGNALTTGYAATSMITLRVALGAGAVIKWCDASQ